MLTVWHCNLHHCVYTTMFYPMYAVFTGDWTEWWQYNILKVHSIWLLVSFPDPTSHEEKGLVNLGRILGSCSMARAD